VEADRRKRKKGIHIPCGGRRRNGLTDHFTLAVYMQFLVAADTGEGHYAAGLPIGACLLRPGAKRACLHTRAAPNTALHLTASSLCFAALRSGFRQQVSLGVRLHSYI